MAFRNPILAGSTLIREGMESENYAAGTDGWRIERDGDAEFNDLTARGDIEAEQVKTPNAAAFVPGGDSIGIVSTDLPAELIAAGFTNGVVFYADDWDAAAITRKVKFRFIVATNAGIGVGYGVCANPSVSQTATIFFGSNLVHNLATGANIFAILGQTNNTILEATSQEIFGQGFWPLLRFRNPSGTEVASFEILDTFEALNYSSGTGLARIVHYINENRLQIPEYFVRDLNWRGFSTLNNSWLSAGGASDCLLRRMPDGTVLFKGAVFKNSVPPSGQQFALVPAGWRPSARVEFHCTHFGALANAQKVSVDTNGICQVWDPPAVNGGISLESIRYCLPEL
jgi:hypothetical protein